MIGRIVIVGILVSALIAGIALYYLQVYAFYTTADGANAGILQVWTPATGQTEPFPSENLRTIDADSSPIRYRACFDTPLSLATMTETFQAYPRPDPLVAPGWFDCFDAQAIGTALDSGAALAVMGTENVHYGIDRVIAVGPDGRGWAWHQINACGEVVFDGNPAPDGCPPAPEGLR